MDPAAIAGLNARRAPTQWGMALPGITTSFPASGRQIALTFDACPGACDDGLLATLERNAVPAVLFLNAKWMDRNPDRAAQLVANPLFEIGNHGTRHVPLSVTGRSAYGIAGNTIGRRGRRRGVEQPAEDHGAGRQTAHLVSPGHRAL